jgi:hypothetical protein
MVHGASLDTRLAPSLDSRERRPLTFVASNGKDVAATDGADITAGQSGDTGRSQSEVNQKGLFYVVRPPS